MTGGQGTWVEKGKKGECGRRRRAFDGAEERREGKGGEEKGSPSLTVTVCMVRYPQIRRCSIGAESRCMCSGTQAVPLVVKGKPAGGRWR